MISVVEMLTTLSSLVWAPLILLVFKRALEQTELKKKLLYTVVTGILLMCQFLGGEPTTLYITVCMLILFSLLFYDKKPWFILAVTFLIAFLFSSFQLLPFLEFLRNSDRSMQSEGTTRILNALWSFPPEGMLALITPGFFKDGSLSEFLFTEKNQIWLKSAFIGLIPVVLALASGLYLFKEKTEKKKYLLFFMLLGFVSLFLAVGRFNIFYEQLYAYLPGYKQIRFPVKFLFPLFLSMAFLAGYTLEKIFEVESKKRKILLKYVLSGAAGIAVLAVFIYIFKTSLLAGVVRYVNPPVSYDNLFFANKNYTEAVTLFLKSAALLLICALGAALFYTGRLKKEIAVGLVILLSAFELFYFNGPINLRVKTTFYREKSGIETFLTENQGSGRAYIARPAKKEAWLQGDTFRDAMGYAKNRLYPNQNMLSGIKVVSGYDSILAGEQYGLLKYISKNQRRRYLDLLSAKYIITEEPFEAKLFPLEYSFDGVSVYLNKYYLPRIFAAKSIKSFLGKDEGLNYIKSDGFDPAKETLVSASSVLDVLPGAEGDKLSLGKETPNSVRISAELTGKKFIVLNDTYYPGWEVYIDGAKETLYRANGIFRGVVCPEGKHDILFKYNPKALKLGGLISIVSVLTVICILFVLYFNEQGIKGSKNGRTISKKNRRNKKSAY